MERNRAAESLVLRFNEQINSGNLNGLAELMTEDHAFVDSAGSRIDGRQQCLLAWKGFFQSFPDYRNVFEALRTSDDIVVVTGYSICADPRLRGSALWAARIHEGRVREWRVFDDTAVNRERLGLGLIFSASDDPSPE